MAKFLFTVWPFPGHVHPNEAIAHALTSRGHDAAFYTGGSLKAQLEGKGFRCFPFQNVDEKQVQAMVQELDSMSLKTSGFRRKKMLLREWLLGTVAAQLQDLKAAPLAWRPDVLVCDPAMWGPLLVFREIAQLPLAIMSYVAACMLPGPEGPIVGLPLPRPRGAIGRLRQNLLGSVANILATDFRKAAEELRAQHGLPPINTSVTAYAGQMPLYLMPGTRAYDRDRQDLPDSVHYVGPCLLDKPGTETPPPWLTELPDDRPLAYVTEGTMHSKPPLLLPAALQGLAAEPVSVVATTGRHRQPGELRLGTIPPNARVEQWVPHSALLPRTDVVITSGGTGTVLAALSAGVPLLIVPTAWDQPENAWRVAEAGAGIRLAPDKCAPDTVKAAVRQLLNDHSYRQNAQRLAGDIKQYGGASQAADLLENLFFKQATRS